MLKYVLRRILFIVPVLFGISLIVFVIMTVIPGDPGTLILGEKATVEQRNMLNEQLGYNKPFAERYVNYIIDAIHGDFGNSYRTRLERPVAKEILASFSKDIKACCTFFSDCNVYWHSNWNSFRSKTIFSS